MNDSNVWKGLSRVSAPPDFEDRVLGALSARLRPDHRSRKSRTFKWALSGSAALLLAVFTALNLFVFKGGPFPGVGGGPAGTLASNAPIALTEGLNYGHEVRAAADAPTIYLLEQVSDTSSSIIRY